MWYDQIIIAAIGGILGTFLSLFFGEPIKSFSKRKMTVEGREQEKKAKIIKYLLITGESYSLEEINKRLFKDKLRYKDINYFMRCLETENNSIKSYYLEDGFDEDGMTKFTNIKVYCYDA